MPVREQLPQPAQNKPSRDEGERQLEVHDVRQPRSQDIRRHLVPMVPPAEWPPHLLILEQQRRLVHGVLLKFLRETIADRRQRPRAA